MNILTGVLRETRRVLNQRDLDTLILFVTNACNLSCGFCCYADNLNQTRDIPHDAMLTISRTMPKFRALLLSGGEPFIRPRLDEIMLAFCRNNGVSVIAIPTNGWYTERTVSCCRSFLEQNQQTTLTISFSVDGLAETHNAVRGRPETFANLCQTLEVLSPWRERHPNLRLRVHSVVTPETVGGLRATIDFFHQRYQLDEHSLEIVRANSVVGAQHDSPERRALIGPYMELTQYAYDLYYRTGARRHGKIEGLGAGLGNLLTYAHSLANAAVKEDRIRGKLWTFPCTAGRKILVIDGSGSLRACEMRGEVVDLRKVDFDVTKALASGAMAEECQRIRKERCDCIHGCFIGTSLQYSPRAIVTRILPKAVEYFVKPKSTG